ncbi:MAG: trehalose-6-phosphate synthase [Acidobacteriia bacterium]|nr:trehalose-6-phosphate synthase [Terriglobia bacterium]
MFIGLIVFKVSVPGYRDIASLFRRKAIALWNQFKGGEGPVRITLRLVVSLFVGITLVASFFAYYQVREEKRSMREELERRASILADSLLAQNVEALVYRREPRGLDTFVRRFGSRTNLAGLEVCDAVGKPLAMTPGLQPFVAADTSTARLTLQRGEPVSQFLTLESKRMQVYARPLVYDGRVIGALLIFHNADYIENQNLSLWENTFLRVLVETLFIALTTLLIIRWSVVGPVARTVQWMREVRAGKAGVRTRPPETDLFQPLTQEITRIAKSLEVARAAAVEEARLREAAESLWTAERLRVHVHSKLQGSTLYAVSNREPYIHVYRGKSVEAQVPASGLVTALEPILRACEGTWIAHGSGDADRDTVDEHDRLRVPPEEPTYTLRRVWLGKKEEEGYYFGFANEGLWPLCHIAHTRPTFRASDWGYYQAVNQKFSDAIVQEMAGSENPTVFAQDYHFALLPRLVKEQRPDARVAIFWHIPWPNAEAFGICPWQRELLQGLLGADLVGFHTQSHCNNFLETVDRTLEARVDWDHFAVNLNGHVTRVRPFPISVEFPETAQSSPPGESVYLERAAMFKELGISATFMGVGVDRVDYTKGILERFRGVERLLEKYPSYQGHFTFVQIGAPSRTHIKRYHDLLAEVEAEAERINWRFLTPGWRPIVFLKRHHTHKEIAQYYRAADICLVTSLHDGMNLVAKEFVAARQDEHGVLLLSCFTGASRELRDALIINPYDTEQLAEAIRYGLEMDSDEQRGRMHRLRHVVRENNIYRWAGDLITELAEIRVEKEPALQTAPKSAAETASPGKVVS